MNGVRHETSWAASSKPPLALVRPRKHESLPQLAAGFGVSTTTAWRYADETIDMHAARTPGVHEAFVGLGEGDFATVAAPHPHRPRPRPATDRFPRRPDRPRTGPARRRRPHGRVRDPGGRRPLHPADRARRSGRHR
ncbi:transposase family protein [Streptomyces sp. NPDC002577]